MWYSPSGLFKLRIDGGGGTINIRVIPDGKYSKTGFGVLVALTDEWSN